MSGHLPTEQQQKLKQIILVCCTLLITILCAFLFVPGNHSTELSSFELDQQGQKVGSGPTEFRIYNQQVYVAVPSNGHYVIPEADPKTIHMLSNDGYQTRHIAVDDRHVYCGNLILNDLNPQAVRSIGDGYLTDGRVTYYCSGGTQLNNDLSGVKKVWQILRYSIGIGSKPQTYIYPYFQLAAGKSPYQLTADGIVSNGEKTYYRGELIDQAKGGELRYLQTYFGNADQMGDSRNYTADGQHVYFRNEKIPVKDAPELMTFDFGSGENSEFLYDPRIKQYYYHQYPFPQKNVPYQILNKNSDHAHDPLFLSKQGIWFFNREKQEVQRISDNPFSEKLIRLGGDIFHDGRDTFYLGIYDKRVRSGRGSKTCYRSTALYRLSNTPLNLWQKIGDVRYGGGTWSSGTVWKNGNQYYYFDEFGSGQGFDQSIYQIKDQRALQIMMNPMQSTDDIRRYLRGGILLKPQAKQVIQAKYDESFCFSLFDSEDD